MLVENSFRNDARVLKEARSLAASGMAVVLLARHEPGVTPQRERIGGFCVQRIALWSERLRGRWTFPLRVFEFLARFTLWALRDRARVYHAHHLTTLLPAAVAAKIYGASVVYDCHELAIALPGDSPMKRRLVRWYEGLLLRMVDRVIMSDGASRARVFRDAHRYSKPVDYVYNCPVSNDVSKCQGRLRQALGIAPSDPVVVYTGAVGPFRGLEVAIRSMASWPPRTHLVMIGPRTEEEEGPLVRVAEEYRVGSRVHFWGPVPPDDVPCWAADADVSIVLIEKAGLSYYYSAPTKMFESIMARVPQVASDFPEIRRVVTGNAVGPVGRLVDPADEAAVGQAVNDLLADEALRCAYRRSADILARDSLNWETQERTLLALYDDVMRQAN